MKHLKKVSHSLSHFFKLSFQQQHGCLTSLDIFFFFLAVSLLFLSIFLFFPLSTHLLWTFLPSCLFCSILSPYLPLSHLLTSPPLLSSSNINSLKSLFHSSLFPFFISLHSRLSLSGGTHSFCQASSPSLYPFLSLSMLIHILMSLFSYCIHQLLLCVNK